MIREGKEPSHEVSFWDNMPDLRETWVASSSGGDYYHWNPSRPPGPPTARPKPGYASCSKAPNALPSFGIVYTVVYRDIWRIVFRAARAPTIIEEIHGGGHLEDFEEVLELRETWEIISEEKGRRIWREVVFPPSDHTMTRYAREDHRPELFTLMKLHTPYTLRDDTLNTRTWTDRFYDQDIVEMKHRWVNPETGKLEIPEYARPREIATVKRTELAIPESKQLILSTTMLGCQVRALIDSGAQGNFMPLPIVERIGVALVEKRESYPLRTVDGSAVGNWDQGVTHETTPIRMKIGDHVEEVTFDIAPIGKHRVILGTPWIRKHNPDVNWTTDEVKFTNCDCERSHQ